MEMNSEASKIAGEDSGIAAAMSCQSCLGDAKGSEVNKEMKQLPKEFWGEGTSPDLDVGKTAGEKGRGPDTGRMDQEEDAELAVETRESAPALLKEEMNDSATESVAASPDAPGAAKGTSAAESEFGVPESLSMKSLSRSLTKEDVTSLSAPAEHEPKELERGRELGRSQTIPRSFGAQSRRSAAQRLEMQSGGTQASADTSVKVNRSTNFGMSGGNSVKRMLLEWCRSKTRDYKYVDIQNFSSCWSDGMAFCALVHKFFPESFDYSALSPKNRKHNFELAFSTAEARADCDPLIEVDDMVRMGRRPDPMCVFTYVQSLCRHLRKLEPVPTATPTGEAT